MVKKILNSKVGKLGKIVYQRFKIANVSDSAVVLAYYILLSLMPMLIILGNLLRFCGVSYTHLINSLYLIFPLKIYKYLKPLVYSSLKSGGKAQVSIGLIITIWSASRALAAFQRTSNLAYGIRKHNVITNRLSSLAWMVVFIIGIICVSFFTIFNEKVFEVMAQYFNFSPTTFGFLTKFKTPFALFILFILLGCLYYLLPKAKAQLKFVWEGSLFSTIGAVLLAKAFSIYLKYFSNSFSTYKAMGIFVILMFWLYFFGLVLLSGAVINASLQQFFEKSINIKHMNPKLKAKIENQQVKIKQDHLAKEAKKRAKKQNKARTKQNKGKQSNN